MKHQDTHRRLQATSNLVHRVIHPQTGIPIHAISIRIIG